MGDTSERHIDDGPVTDPSLRLVHERQYTVKAYRGDGSLVLHGEVRDSKPAAQFIAGDPDPVTIHAMDVELTINVPDMVIGDVRVTMPTHPYLTCEDIVTHYRTLIGTSLTRGFSNRVRELFGGPRGCAHTTALIQAMAPVAMQAAWSGEPADAAPKDLPAYRTRGGGGWAVSRHLNSCHVWSDTGEQVAALRGGAPLETPIWLSARLRERAEADALTSMQASGEPSPQSDSA